MSEIAEKIRAQAARYGTLDDLAEIIMESLDAGDPVIYGVDITGVDVDELLREL